MKGQKKIGRILERLYVRGVIDGLDLARDPDDRFFGDRISREKWEKEKVREATALILKEMK
jgi:hypothetical protein